MTDNPDKTTAASAGASAARTTSHSPAQAECAPAPPNLATFIEADGAYDDGASDDGYGSSAPSAASTSISSSVRDYTFEANRRYHKFQEGSYQFPNDDPEQEREDMKHAMVTNLCGGRLHFAPLENPQNILDLGTGTGIWVIDMADEYPEADILGIDLSPIQPSWVPPNARFMVDDFEAEWLHDPDTFDYIHARHLTAAIRDWPALLSQAHKALKPGAWIELQDLKFSMCCDDSTLREDNKVVEWLDFITQGLAVFNVDMLAVQHNKQRLIDAGFVNVQERIYKIPLGVWPKDEMMKVIGMYNRSVFADAFQGVSVKPLGHGLKWTPEEIEVYLTGVRKDVMDSSQHAYIPFHVVTGQKRAEA